MRRIKVGLLGCGTVGGGFVRLLEEHRDLIRERAEADVEITRILVRDPVRERPFVDSRLLTTRASDVVGNGASVIVELVGGLEPARGWIRESLCSGKHVVTANKALLSAGGDLFGLAAVHRVRLGFEASVCGAIPVVRVIRDGLAGDRIRSITGIVNGTSNYVLSRGACGVAFADAVAEAQKEGFAEADPSLDVDGEDAAQKITILARLAFGTRKLRWIAKEGIRAITVTDHLRARDDGFVIRQVASAAEKGQEIELEVRARRVPLDSELGRTVGVENSVIVRSDAAGELTLRGAGAGSLPSASSVLADLIEIVRAM